MARQTYFVVQPFAPGKGGKLEPKPAMPAQSRDQAERVARRLGERGGAVAFSRTGDPQLGEYDEAVVIGAFGELPEDAIEAMSAA